MNDNEAKVAKNRVWAGAIITGMIVCCGFVWELKIAEKTKA